MLYTRVLTAICTLPLLAAFLAYAPGVWVLAFFVLCLGLSLWEIIDMIYPRLLAIAASTANKSNSQAKVAWANVSFGMIGTFWFCYADEISKHLPVVGLISLGATVFFFAFVFLEQDLAKAMVGLLTSLLALAYCLPPWLAIWHLYQLKSQAYFVFLLLFIVMANDSGAYFGGRFFGGKIFGQRKLSPRLSPKKTIEGAVVGLVSGVIAAITIATLWGQNPFSLLSLAFTAMIVGIVSILGDLVESYFKRFAQVKDSGKVLPGHGGFLDRVDGIMFGASALYALLLLFEQKL